MIKNRLEKIMGYGMLIMVTCAAFIINVNAGSIVISNKTIKEDETTKKYTVVIDAGHGGYDPGKIGITGRQEKEINLEIALKLQNYLEDNGINTVMTRTGDISLCEDDISGTTGKKAADMKKRVDIVNTADADLCISIHQNSYDSKEVKGAQVFYYSKSEKGKEFAELLQSILKADVDTNNKRMAKENNSYYMLLKVECPAVIVECGFLSNWEEATALADEFYQEKIVEAIYKAITEYLSNI